MKNKTQFLFSVLMEVIILSISLLPLSTNSAQAANQQIDKKSDKQELLTAKMRDMKLRTSEMDPDPDEEIIYNPSANGDNRKDLIAFDTKTTAISVTLGTGSNFGGGFLGSETWNTNSGYNPKEWQLLKPSDVDGDGDLDIIAFNIRNTQIDVTLSDGKSFGGGYRGYQVWNRNSGYSPKSWVLLDPADVNGDWRADIIAFNPKTNQIDVTLSNGYSFGGGNRGYQVWNKNSGYSTKDWELLTPSDVDGDNMADIVAKNKKTTAIDVTLSNGRSFGGGNRGYQVWVANSGYNSYDWYVTSVSDIDGDWLSDIVAWSRFGTGQVDVLISNGKSFGNKVTILEDQGYLCTHGYPCPYLFLDPSDVNDDGYADIIINCLEKVYVNYTDESETEFWYIDREIWNSNIEFNKEGWKLIEKWYPTSLM